MVLTMTLQAAAPSMSAMRTRPLATQGTPFALPAGVGTWQPIHNSIPATLRPAVVQTEMGHPSVNADRGVYGAAKQEGPPRGVPR